MTADLTWLLRRLVDAVPNTQSALLLSSDGIAVQWYGLDTDGADTLAALASGLCSLAQQVGSRFGGGPGIRQVNSELDDVVLFATAASENSILAVLANREVDAGILGYEMAKLASQVPAYLATPSRYRPSSVGNGSW